MRSLDSVGGILGLRPLAIEDSREFGQRPKLDRYDDRFLLVFFGVHLGADKNPERSSFTSTLLRARCSP
jgi:magnesium transporter